MSPQSQQSRDTGDDYNIETKEFSGREGPPHVQRRAHWHSDIEINLLTQGQVTYLWHDRLMTLRQGTLALFWAGIPHQVVAVKEPAHCFWIYLPLTWFLQWKLQEDFSQSVLNGRMITRSVSRHQALEPPAIRQWVADLAVRSPERNAIVLLELEARVRRLALDFKPRARNAPNVSDRASSGSLWALEAMARFMAREYRNPIGLADVSRAARLNPNYASSLFSRVCGISMRTYLNRLRISHAQRLLATTDMKVVDIAMDAGFASLSRFYAAFESACRTTPQAYRHANAVTR